MKKEIIKEEIKCLLFITVVSTIIFLLFGSEDKIQSFLISLVTILTIVSIALFIFNRLEKKRTFENIDNQK